MRSSGILAVVAIWSVLFAGACTSSSDENESDGGPGGLAGSGGAAGAAGSAGTGGSAGVAGADAGDDASLDAEADASGDGEVDGGPPVAEWPASGVTLIDLDGAGHATVESTFDGASPLPNLDWAVDVSCWSSTDALTVAPDFDGEHQAFALREVVPEYSEVTITVTPNTATEANLYVIQELPSQADIPPNISDTVFCEVPIQRPLNTPQTIKLRTYAGQERHIYFGVTHSDRFAVNDTGTFTVDVDVTPLVGADRCYDDIPKPESWPPTVNVVTLNGGSAIVQGDLSMGESMCEDQWMVDRTCAPGTRLQMFDGNHVLYAIDGGIPDHSYLTVTVTPDPGVDVSLYGNWQGTTDYYAPPNLTGSNCEASYYQTFAQSPTFNDGNPGEVESLTFHAINNPYNIVFGVAGSQGQGATGGYIIDIDLIDTSTNSCVDGDYDAVIGLNDWPGSVTQIPVTVTNGFGTASVSGNLATGSPLCTLDWAADSSVACFPATDNDYFLGNHVFFALDTPPPAGSTVEFDVVPDAGVEVSAYAFRIGRDSYTMPPFVPSVVQCEASYNFALGTPPNPGAVESVAFYGGAEKEYNYFLGVAAYDGNAGAGAFTVRANVTTPPPAHCPESLPGASYATWPSNYNLISLDSNGVGSATGNLNMGSCMNLEFADNSDVACFPQTRFDRYEGNHVFYALDEVLPPDSEVTITVTPDAGVDVSLYGFQSGTTRFPVPPAVSNTICEASYGLSGANPGAAESITFQNPTGNSYNISFAVAGTDTGGTSGGYTIDVQRDTAIKHCPGSLPGPTGLSAWPANVTQISANSSTAGNLNSGACTNLEFAENSAVACFPATEFEEFEGNHVFYALDQPMPGNSVLTVTLTPGSVASPNANLDVNLYGLQLGTTTFMVPPAVPSAICEASYGVPFGNPGDPETISFYSPNGNPYNIFLAVAGPAGVNAGAFELETSLTTGSIHCASSLPGQPQVSWPAEVNLVSLTGGTVPGRGSASNVPGNLSTGGCVNLEWAQNSSTACFPGTQFTAFEGNHVYYALETPIPPHTEVTVKLNTGNTNANVYGYMIGKDSYFVPPYVPLTISCEATNVASSPLNDQIVFWNNSASSSYNIFFAVAGTAGTTTQSYDFTVNSIQK